MGIGLTRATVVWIVAAAVVGSAAGVLWVLRSDLGGDHSATAVLIGAVVLTLLAAGLLYRGILVAAGEQDRRAERLEERRRQERATR
ncbi:MAG: hypothetical protein JWP82_3369 [Humibacillus sp.]|nr:hypothetical protein [Humibacillus sp.]